jgi:hypothetical protein
MLCEGGWRGMLHGEGLIKSPRFFNREKLNVLKEDAINEDSIVVRFDNVIMTDCSSAIIVPERSLREAGFIKTLTAHARAHSKHEFHAMAQMAFYQFQDGELESTAVQGIVTVERGTEVEKLAAGMVICRDRKGNFHLLVHEGQNAKKLLEATHRFCTRWVRLDI